MPTVELKYGRGSLPFQYDPERFDLLNIAGTRRAMTDADLGARLDSPCDTAPLEDIVTPGESVLLVVPDATRQAAAGQAVNLIVRRLIANGTAAHDIHAIFATGIHRKVTTEEKAAILTPFIAQRIVAYDHDPRDLMQLIHVGETSGGIAVELNRRLFEHDHVVLIGGVTFHYFAGFTGGRKLVCPGLASSRTISATHKLAFDCETRGRTIGVGTGLLDGNPVHEAFVEAAAFAKPVFAIDTMVDDDGNAVDMFCGEWINSHRAACDAFARSHTVAVAERRDTVIVSCGGRPLDINMIQAHKSLEGAAGACRDGGTIILLAECGDGLGRDDLLTWFDAGSSDGIAERLCEKYQVNGQTAWSLRQKTERFRVSAVSALDADVLRKMGIEKIDSVPTDLPNGGRGYIIPNGAKINVELSADQAGFTEKVRAI